MANERRKISTEEELVNFYKDPNTDEIEVHGDLRHQIVHIKAKGKVAWGVAMGCIIVGVGLIITTPATGGTSTIPGTLSFGPAIAAIGVSSTMFLVGLGLAAGASYVGIIKWLYNDAQIIEQTDDYIVLKK